METLDQLRAQLASIQTGVAAVATLVTTLQQQVANAGTIPDDIQATVAGLGTALANITNPPAPAGN